MAAGPGGRSTEHDASDRRFFAGLLIVLGLLGTGLALAHRQQLPHSSQPGDACPVTASGGLVGFDARTGEVRWTNIVPESARVAVDEPTGDVVVRTMRQAAGGQIDVRERTVDPDDGRITGCDGAHRDITSDEAAALMGWDDALDPPIELDGTTIAAWADGIRATDGTNTGIWSVRNARALARDGDDLIAATSLGIGAREGVARLDLRTGAEEWSVDEHGIRVRGTGATVLTSPWDDEGAVVSRDPATGEARWTARLPAAGDGFVPWAFEVFDVGPLVLAPLGDGARLVALDPETGRTVWTGDGASPGRNWKHSEPGSIDSAVLSPDGRTVIATITAWVPDPTID